MGSMPKGPTGVILAVFALISSVTWIHLSQAQSRSQSQVKKKDATYNEGLGYTKSGADRAGTDYSDEEGTDDLNVEGTAIWTKRVQ